MYSKPRKFTIFYFYFLLVVYGFWSKPTWRCPACMRGVAWQMLFGNLLFVLGVPVAIVQLFRSYGFTELSGPFKGLDKGNIHARKGNFEAALMQYREIMNRVPNCAGLKYNLGLALLQQGDKSSAAKSFASALDDCANYAPAYQRLRPLCEELGDAPRLAALKAQWETPEAAPA
jgi:tetratricopeptide (TPR) repeat protein